MDNAVWLWDSLHRVPARGLKISLCVIKGTTHGQKCVVLGGRSPKIRVAV